MPSNEPNGDSQALCSEWLGRLSDLVESVKVWSEELGWSTRRISKRMHESQLGAYEAPALMLQKDFTRVLLDPVARFAPGTEGVVDLYLMPAYDDIASLYWVGGQWRFHYMVPGRTSAGAVPEAESVLLNRESLSQILDEMTSHAAASL